MSYSRNQRIFSIDDPTLEDELPDIDDETEAEQALAELATEPSWRDSEVNRVVDDLVSDGLTTFLLDATSESDDPDEEAIIEAETFTATARKFADRKAAYDLSTDPAQLRVGWFGDSLQDIANHHDLTQQGLGKGRKAHDEWGDTTGLYLAVHKPGKLIRALDPFTGEATGEVQSREPDSYWRPTPLVWITYKVKRQITALLESKKQPSSEELRSRSLEIVLMTLETERRQPRHIKLRRLRRNKPKRKSKTLIELRLADIDRGIGLVDVLEMEAEPGSERKRRLGLIQRGFKTNLAELRKVLTEGDKK